MMNRTLCSMLAAIGMSACGQPLVWPSLPQAGFVVGRVATKADVESGSAVFVAEKDGTPVSKPLKIAVPQYAWHKDGSRKSAVIVIQAEEANGQGMIGAKTLSGSYMAGLLEEFELLGSAPPK